MMIVGVGLMSSTLFVKTQVQKVSVLVLLRLVVWCSG